MSYIVYHPGTGTIVAEEDSYLVPIEELPVDPEEWEAYLASEWFTAYKIVRGKELL